MLFMITFSQYLHYLLRGEWLRDAPGLEKRLKCQLAQICHFPIVEKKRNRIYTCPIRIRRVICKMHSRPPTLVLLTA